MAPMLEDDEKDLLVELGEALRSTRTGREDVVEAGKAAWAWRWIDLELELAMLASDSLLDASAAMRAGADTAARLLIFEGTTLAVEVEIAGRNLVGQILPPGLGEVTLLTPAGEAGRTCTDEAGCFSLPLPPGPLRLRCRSRQAVIVTDWVRL